MWFQGSPMIMGPPGVIKSVPQIAQMGAILLPLGATKGHSRLFDLKAWNRAGNQFQVKELTGTHGTQKRPPSGRKGIHRRPSWPPNGSSDQKPIWAFDFGVLGSPFGPQFDAKMSITCKGRWDYLRPSGSTSLCLCLCLCLYGIMLSNSALMAMPMPMSALCLPVVAFMPI